MSRYPTILKLLTSLPAVRAAKTVYFLAPWKNSLIRMLQWNASRPPVYLATSALNLDLDTDLMVSELRRNGYSARVKVPRELTEEIGRAFDMVGRSKIANPHETIQAVWEIAHSSSVLEVAGRYLGGYPFVRGSRLYRTRGELQPERKGFHHDVGSFRPLNLFVYMTDVDEDCGPHEVIEGTHRGKSFRQMCSREIAPEVAEMLYPDRIRTILGASGTGFFEDLHTFHRHQHGTRTRLILSIAYDFWRGSGRMSPARKPMSS